MLQLWEKLAYDNGDRVPFEHKGKNYFLDTVITDDSTGEVYITDEIGKPVLQSVIDENWIYGRFKIIYGGDSNFSEEDLNFIQLQICEIPTVSRDASSDIMDAIK